MVGRQGVLTFAAACVASAIAAGCGADDNQTPPGDGGSAAADASLSGDAHLGDGPHDGGPVLGDAGSHGDAASLPDGMTREGGAPVASFIAPPFIDFGRVGCGAPAASQNVAFSNRGTAMLAVSAITTGGGAFSVSPSTLLLAPGGDGALKVTATVPGSGVPAGTPLTGSLNIFTNDPAAANTSSHLSVTPSGATLVLQPSDVITFPSVKVGQPAPPQSFTVTNLGNMDGILTVSALPSGSGFAFDGVPDGGLPVPAAGATVPAGGGTWKGTVDFTPPSKNVATTTATLGVSGTTCAESLPSAITFRGAGSTGQITPSATAIDFGLGDCGGAAPVSKTFTLMNAGPVDALITSCSLPGGACSLSTGGLASDGGAPLGFTTTAAVGQVVAAATGAGPGQLTITVNAPAVPAYPSSMANITGVLTIGTDADATGMPTTIALQETPHGAVLTFDPPAMFGTFGQEVLLVPPPSSATQAFKVKNAGNADATVTVSAAVNGPAGAGLDAGADADAGGIDATIADASGTPLAPATFQLAQAMLAVPAGQEAADSVTFVPVAAGGVVGSLAIATAGVVCQASPSPLTLTGSGIGGGATINPTTVAFQATCGGAAPADVAVTLTNSGTVNLKWTLSPVTGAGAALYTVSPSPAPGFLAPGAVATITVKAPAIASPALQLDPNALAASMTIETDIPYDPPHVIPITEVPLGDQLSFSATQLKFGEVPVGIATVPQTFTVTNSANPGSPDAKVSLSFGGDGGAGFTVTPPTSFPNVSAGTSSSTASVTFDGPTNQFYEETVEIATTDTNLCTPLPAPLILTGTGTMGQILVTPMAVAFGTDPKDPKGLVNCGATGPPQTVTVTNVGNQAFHVTGLQLGLTPSPYALSIGGATVTSGTLAQPLPLPIGGPAVAITITPAAIPAVVLNPDDPSPFSDVLTITTDVPGDTPHTAQLTMQAQGAVIVDSGPAGSDAGAGPPALSTNWSFGTIGLGSVGTITSTIQNAGNAPVSITLTGLSFPTIFGLQTAPTIGAANASSAIVGRFTPPSSNGSWTDQGTLTVGPPSALCAPLPAHWNNPTIQLTGSSNSNSAVTYSGSLAFPGTECGNAAPSAQPITLTNSTNVAYLYTLGFGVGAHYTIANAGPGTLAANGNATVLIAPRTVTPGQGVVPGSNPYADSLIVHISTMPPTVFNIPISWAVNGAVFSLPRGAGPNTDAMGHSFYPADTMSATSLSLMNSGNEHASVDFAVQPLSGVVSLSPAPVTVYPGTSTVQLTSTAPSACPSATAATVTFVYSGAVCQPFSIPAINVQACSGTFH